MGQLIKLQDYASRYEHNIFHYPSRFVTLKKQQWDKLVTAWEDPLNEPLLADQMDKKVQNTEGEKRFIGKIKSLFHRKNDFEEINLNSDMEKQDEGIFFDALPTFVYRPETINDLKQHFLNQLFDFQMKWATSTLREKSFVNKKFYYDQRLKYFLQRFPDTYLVLYQPVFTIKKASVEVETILISPTDVWCITFLEDVDLSTFVGDNQKFWSLRNKTDEKKVINPMIAANRTGTIVKKIFELYEIDLPIHKVLLSRNGYIDYPTAPYDVKIVDKRKYEEWFNSLRELRSPLKHTQLKGAEALLRYCQTSSIKRMEWEVTDG